MTRGRTLRVLFPLLLGALLHGLVGASPAAAHTELVRSTPKDGAKLAEAPDHLTLTFDEPVDLADVRAMTPDGDRLPVSRAPHGTADTVRIATGEPVKGALYVVWSVVDREDGHASSGRLAFGIGTAAGTAAAQDSQAHGDQAATPSPSPLVRKSLVAARWAGYLALAVFVGGTRLRRAARGRAARRQPGRGPCSPWPGRAGCCRRSRRIGLQGAYVSRSAACATRCARRRTPSVLITEPGVALAARGLLWVLAAVVLSALLQGGAGTSRSPGWRVGALAVALGLLRTTGMRGPQLRGRASRPGARWPTCVHLLGASPVDRRAGHARRWPCCRAASPSSWRLVVPGYSQLAGASRWPRSPSPGWCWPGRSWARTTPCCTPRTGSCCWSRPPSSALVLFAA